MTRAKAITSLGLNSGFVSAIPGQLAQFPYIAMFSMSVLGVSDNNSYYVHASDNFSASVDKELGKHSLKGLRLPQNQSSR